MDAKARERLHSFTRRQHGLVTSAQTRAAGTTAEQIEHALRTGELVRRRDGVYASAAVSETRRQAILAAVLAAGDGAVTSHATAGWVGKMPGIDAVRIELLAPFGHHHRLVGVVGHRSRALFDDDRTMVDGIPTTTPERTLVDLTARYPMSFLSRVLDDGLRRGTIRRDRLARTVGRLTSGPGRRLGVARELLAARDASYDPGESDLETTALRVMAAAGLPIPRQQYRIQIGARRFRIDLAYPDLKIGIELDGWEYHGGRSAFDADRARGNLIAIAGWLPLSFTSRSAPVQIVADITAARAARAHSTPA